MYCPGYFLFIYVSWCHSLLSIFTFRCSQLFAWGVQEADEPEASISLIPRFFEKTGDLLVFLFLFTVLLKNGEIDIFPWQDILKGSSPLWISLNFFCILLLQPFNLRIFSKPPSEYFALSWLIFFSVKIAECGKQERRGSWRGGFIG